MTSAENTRIEKGRLNAKRDQLLRAGEIAPERLRAKPFLKLWRTPAVRASGIHKAFIGRECNRSTLW